MLRGHRTVAQRLRSPFSTQFSRHCMPLRDNVTPRLILLSKRGNENNKFSQKKELNPQLLRLQSRHCHNIVLIIKLALTAEFIANSKERLCSSNKTM